MVMNVWEAARCGDIQTLQNLKEKHGITVLSKRHPTPHYLIQQAKEEAEWKDSKGQNHHSAIKGGLWTPLHVASAYGQTNTVKWLLQMQVSADQKDSYPRETHFQDTSKVKKTRKKETTHTTGWNALHWASHIGDLSLIQELLPATTLSPATKKTLCSVLQYTTKTTSQIDSKNTNELYTWGTGIHFGLGNGTSNTRAIPYRVLGGLEKLSVELCANSKYYTVCVCVDEKNNQSLWSWGIDKEGCLGLGKEGITVPLPTRIEFDTIVIGVAVGPSHSCFVTDEGFVFTFGSGSNGKLGHGNLRSYSTPTCVVALYNTSIQAVAAGDNHTVAISSKGEVFSWGSGEHGQTGLGLFDDTTTPKRVPGLAELQISAIAAQSNVTIALQNNQKRIYYFGNGHNTSTSTHNPFPGKSGTVTSIACGAKFMSYCTNFGKAFVAIWKDEKIKKVNNQDVLYSNLSPFQEIDLQGSTACFVASSKDKLFVYDQEQQIWEFPKLPVFEIQKSQLLDNVTQLICSNYHCAAIVSRMKQNHRVSISPSQHGLQFASLLVHSDYSDLVLCSTDNQYFHVHRCILNAHCPYFTKLLSKHNEQSNPIQVDLESTTLRCLLEILYTGKIVSDVSMTVTELRSLLVRFNISQFLPMETVEMKYNLSLELLALIPSRFYSLYTSAVDYDIVIQSKAAEQIPCHRAVLAARSDFFEALLSSGFRECENGIIHIPNSSYEAIKKVVEFLYCDDIKRDTQSNVITEVLILANEFMLDRLKEICEAILSTQVHMNTLELYLGLSDLHSAFQLRTVCFEYILDHLYEIIECGMFLSFPATVVSKVQELLNERMASFVSNPEQSQALHRLVFPPRYFISAMEKEFRFGEDKDQGLDDDSVSTLELKHVENSTRVRNLRKKLYQIYRIEEKKQAGEKLLPAQTSKMYQRPVLLQQLSELTGESIDTLLRETKETFLNSNTNAPMAQSSDLLPNVQQFAPSEATLLPDTLPKPQIENEPDEEAPMNEAMEEIQTKNENSDLRSAVDVATEMESKVETETELQEERPVRHEKEIHPSGNKKGRRRRNNSQRKANTFSLTSPNKSPQGNKPKTSPMRIPPSTTPASTNSPQAKSWGTIAAKNQSFSIADIQKEEIKKGGEKKSDSVTIPKAKQTPTRSGWCSPPKSAPVSFLDIQMQQKNPQGRKGKGKRKTATSTSPSSSLTSAPRRTAKPISFSELMAQEEQNKQKTKNKPKLRDIMGQELTAKALSNPYDANLEQQLIQLAIQASLEDK